MSWSNQVLSVEEDEIDLLELIRTLLQAWKIIVGITLFAQVLAVVYALYAPRGLQGRNFIGSRQKREIWIILS